MAEMSIDERIARQILADEKALALKLAEAQTPAYGSKRISPEEEIKRWVYEDPAVDVDALRVEGLNDRTMGLLKDVGVDTDKIDMPAYQRLMAAGTPDETWIAALKHPYRVRLMKSAGRVLDLEQQVAYVDRMHKRLGDHQSEQQTAADSQGAVAAEMLTGQPSETGGY